MCLSSKIKMCGKARLKTSGWASCLPDAANGNAPLSVNREQRTVMTVVPRSQQE